MIKILVIEDDENLIEVYKKKLHEVNYSVLIAKTGQEGLDIIRNAKPDLVLLDIMLPGGMNGFDVLEEIRGDENTAKLKVIVMSNLDSEEKEARLIGVEDYIIKANTSIDEVMKKIANILSV